MASRDRYNIMKAAERRTAAMAIEKLTNTLELAEEDCLLADPWIRVYKVPSKGRRLFKDRYCVLWYSTNGARYYGSTNYFEAITIATAMLTRELLDEDLVSTSTGS